MKDIVEEVRDVKLQIAALNQAAKLLRDEENDEPPSPTVTRKRASCN